MEIFRIRHCWIKFELLVNTFQYSNQPQNSNVSIIYVFLLFYFSFFFLESGVSCLKLKMPWFRNSTQIPFQAKDCMCRHNQVGEVLTNVFHDMIFKL